jgi:hypothetical protein
MVLVVVAGMVLEVADRDGSGGTGMGVEWCGNGAGAGMVLEWCWNGAGMVVAESC